MKRGAEVAVGAAILLSLLLITGGTLWLSGVAFGDDEITVRARFREVGHVVEGNAVKLRGVAIGRVEDMHFEPSGQGVIVELRIARDAPLPPEPVVLLSPESMFGDWQAEILPRDRFPHYGYAESPDPAVLPGYALPDISRLTAVADRIAENLAVLTERVELAFTEETARHISQAIENIQEMSTQLTALLTTQEQTVQEVAENLEHTTATLGETADAVQRTFGRIETAVADGQVTEIMDNIRRTTAQVDSLSAMLVAASTKLDSTLGHAENTFRTVDGVANTLARGEGTLGLLVQDTTLYMQLVETNRALKALLEDIQANPGRYVKVEVF